MQLDFYIGLSIGVIFTALLFPTYRSLKSDVKTLGFSIVIIKFLKLLLSYFSYILRQLYDKEAREISERKVIKKIQQTDQGEIRGNHAGIFICLKKRFGFLDKSVYLDGADILIDRFLMEKIPFKVYVCDKSIEFRQIIENENVNLVWIFGHGTKQGVDFVDRFVNYCEFSKFEEAQKKDFIGQFHCNSHGGCSLDRYILREGGIKFIEDGVSDPFQNRKAVQSLLDKHMGYFKEKTGLQGSC
ncbi:MULTISPECIES: hypothetical protein [unclassified Methanoculleus]|uniref:hypothetical protein n=1 Tax=unclassified Methanoculleus TaxID=2619537 RepID=UPI0025FD4EC0|nr:MULTISPECIES: hypothetical protein [unclassified Methanoculleus]